MNSANCDYSEFIHHKYWRIKSFLLWQCHGLVIIILCYFERYHNSEMVAYFK